MPKSAGGEYRFDGTYTTLLSCYEDKKVAWESSGNPTLDTEMVNSIKTLEESFNCSGLCQAPDFWISKDVTEGPPPNACVFNLKDRFNKSGGALAYATAGTGFVIFCIFIFHYGLYLIDPAEVKNRKRRFIFDN